MPWWVWIVFGLALSSAEILVTTAFFLVALGAAALVVGLLVLGGVLASPAAQWFAFSGLGIVAILLVRRIPAARSAPVEDLVGETGTTLAGIAPGAVGRAELRGSPWTVRNAGDRELAEGERCRVTAVHGLRLDVVPD